MGIIDLYRKNRREKKGRRHEHESWVQRGFSAPYPSDMKRATLMRLGVPGAVWVETGTFMGDTTEMLSKNSLMVYTIEPDNALYERASARFSGRQNVRVLHGLSESIFPQLLPEIRGVVNFWLDGHYSGGITHQGPTDCPVRQELSAIQQNIGNFEAVNVIIDDIRCFDPELPEYKDYPDRDYLVDWARQNRLVWHIENDMFVAKSRSLKKI